MSQVIPHASDIRGNTFKYLRPW